MSEVAALVRDPSVVSAALGAAKAYPFLRIVCPWCQQSVKGEVFEAHCQAHQDDGSTPSHWMAL